MLSFLQLLILEVDAHMLILTLTGTRAHVLTLIRESRAHTRREGRSWKSKWTAWRCVFAWFVCV